MPLIIKPTIDESITTIAAAICAVWESDVDTPAVYAEHCRVHAADLHHSVIARDTEQDALAGIGVLCRRGDRGFVLDFGIAPSYRQAGNGYRVFDALMAQSSQANLREVSLLVSEENEAAQRIYQHAGFVVVRRLESLRGRPRRSEDTVAVSPVSGHDLPSVLNHWCCQAVCAKPQWERELASLLVMADVKAFTTPHGFIMGRQSPYHRQVDIVHMGLMHDVSLAEVSALLQALGVAYDPRLPVALLEEPAESAAFHALQQLGFRSMDHPYLEMKCQLD